MGDDSGLIFNFRLLGDRENDICKSNFNWHMAGDFFSENCRRIYLRVDFDSNRYNKNVYQLNFRKEGKRYEKKILDNNVASGDNFDKYICGSGSW